MQGPIHIASCVGGGPMERLARRLAERGAPTEVVSKYSGDAWRNAMSQGTRGRLAARLHSFISFPLSVVARARRDRPAALVPTTNPFVLPFIAVALRPLHRRPVVPLVYDLWPDALEAGGLASEGGPMSRLGAAANRFWFSRADGVVFIGHRMARHAIARYGQPKRWTVIETGADQGELCADSAGPDTPESDLERWCDGRTVCAYVGNMGRMHDVATLRDAVPLLLADPAAARLAIVIAASGPGVDELKKAWLDLPKSQIRFEPPLDDRAWARLLLRTAIAFVTLRDEASKTCIPSKAFSALAAGEALCVIAPEDSDLAELVRLHRCGLHTPTGDPGALAAALTALASDPEALEDARAAAKTAARDHYDMIRLAERWQTFLEGAG
ncbi:MAG: glycosyltransferase [Myxococcota bacterium]